MIRASDAGGPCSIPLPSSYTPEERLLLQVAQGRPTPDEEEGRRAPGEDDFDWPTLVKGAIRHGVLPLVHRRARRLGCPDEIYAGMANVVAKRTPLTLFQAREQLRLLELLNAAGIRAVPFKGPMMALRLYGDVTLRWSNDIDILVSPSRMTEAVALLERRGYKQEGGPISHWNPGRDLAGHHRPMVHESPHLRLEVHWTASSLRLGVRLGVEAMLDRASPVQKWGTSFSRLQSEDLLLLLLLHGFEHEWEGIKWITDVRELLRLEDDEIDWERLTGRAKTMGCLRVLRVGLLVVAASGGAAHAGEVEEVVGVDSRSRRLARRSLSKLFTPERTRPDAERTLSKAILRIRGKDNGWDALRYAAAYIFSPTATDLRILPVPTVPLWIYAVIRPFRLMMRATALLWSSSRARLRGNAPSRRNTGLKSHLAPR